MNEWPQTVRTVLARAVAGPRGVTTRVRSLKETEEARAAIASAFLDQAIQSILASPQFPDIESDARTKEYLLAKGAPAAGTHGRGELALLLANDFWAIHLPSPDLLHCFPTVPDSGELAIMFEQDLSKPIKEFMVGWAFLGLTVEHVLRCEQWKELRTLDRREVRELARDFWELHPMDRTFFDRATARFEQNEALFNQYIATAVTNYLDFRLARARLVVSYRPKIHEQILKHRLLSDLARVSGGVDRETLAEDMTQAFMATKFVSQRFLTAAAKDYEHKHSLDADEPSFRKFIQTAIKWFLGSEIRKKLREKKTVKALVPGDDDVGSAPTGIDVEDAVSLARWIIRRACELMEAKKKINQNTYRLFLRYYIEPALGLAKETTMKAAAEELGVSRDNTAARLKHGRKVFREMILESLSKLAGKRLSLEQVDAFVGEILVSWRSDPSPTYEVRPRKPQGKEPVKKAWWKRRKERNDPDDV